MKPRPVYIITQKTLGNKKQAIEIARFKPLCLQLLEDVREDHGWHVFFDLIELPE